MPDTDDATYRQQFRAPGGDVTVREPDEVEDGDGVFEVRMPIASTGQVRNEGDEPLTRDELNGMARQLNERQIGVFPAHGNDSMIASGRYSPFERLGDWREGEIESREDTDVLMATARMPDPDSLPDLGEYRRALGILKEQAKRGIGQDSSIGWRDDDSFPGGVDLMEASIVGIGADWRTNTNDEAAEVVAREAVAAGADPDELVDRVERAVRDTQTDDMTDDPDTDTDTTAEQDADTESGESTERDFQNRMLEMQQEQTDLLRALLEREDEDDEDDEDEDEQEADDEDEEEDEDDEDEQSSDEPDETQDTDSDVSERVAELEAELAEIREGGLSGDDVETPEPDESQDADTDDETTEQRENDGGPENAGISISDLN